jgi:hypothetical protein
MIVYLAPNNIQLIVLRELGRLPRLDGIPGTFLLLLQEMPQVLGFHLTGLCELDLINHNEEEYAGPDSQHHDDNRQQSKLEGVVGHCGE